MKSRTRVLILGLLVLGCDAGTNPRRLDGAAPDGALSDGSAPDGRAPDGRVPGDGAVAPADGGIVVPPETPTTTVAVDVAVFGAGTGGVAAAIQAARMGARVALVEETDWVGGQATAAGVSTMDEGRFGNAFGIYAEWIARVEAHYASLGKRARRCGIRGVPCMEPSVGQRFLRELLAEAGVTLYERARLVRADMDRGGARPVIVSVDAYQATMARVLSVEASVFIDATEHGDLLPIVGAGYRFGRSTDAALDGSACVQDVTYAPIIRRYPGGAPAELRITAPPPGYGPAVEADFAAIVAAGGHDWDVEGWGAGYPVDWNTHVSYRATPDSAAPADSVEGRSSSITRTGVNWANDWPATVDDLGVRRFEHQCAAKLRTIQFLYYAQVVLGQREWSVANDEGYDSPFNREDNDCPELGPTLDPIERHLPPIPYVREARRMIGLYTMSARDVQRPGGGAPSTRLFPTSIAVASYGMDLHGCSEPGDLEASLESVDDRPGFVGGAFQVPFEVFVSSSVDNLVAAEKNLSQSRFVNGATRLQPSTMHTGQAAGALAYLASSRARRPRDLAPLEVQGALIDVRARVSPYDFPDVPVDSAYWPGVELSSARGILRGLADGTFAPTADLTRSQAAVFLSRLLELDTSSPPATPSFSDVPTTHFAYAEIEAVLAAGITAGCGAAPARYCPDDSLSRAQAATMLARGLSFRPEDAPTAPLFEDVPASNVHFPAIQWLAARGIVNGCSAAPRLYCPSEPLRRGQAALLTRPTLTARLP